MKILDNWEIENGIFKSHENLTPDEIDYLIKIRKARLKELKKELAMLKTITNTMSILN